MSDKDYSKEKQEALHAAIQGQNPYVPPDSILVSWVLASTWVLPNGERTLTKCSSEGMKEWEAMGLLHGALEGEFSEDDNDDE